MRVMVFTTMAEGAGPFEPPPSEAFKAMDRFIEELVAAGVFVAAAGLKPTAEGRRVVVEGEDRTVVDGPFAESKEVVAGFSIWQVKDMDEAVAWARRCPNPMPGRCVMEIRPFFEFEDLADVLPPDPEGAAPRDEARTTLGVA
jgi:hypothetical protein